jgi:hypothetical protein
LIQFMKLIQKKKMDKIIHNIITDLKDMADITNKPALINQFAVEEKIYTK